MNDKLELDDIDFNLESNLKNEIEQIRKTYILPTENSFEEGLPKEMETLGEGLEEIEQQEQMEEREEGEEGEEESKKELKKLMLEIFGEMSDTESDIEKPRVEFSPKDISLKGLGNTEYTQQEMLKMMDDANEKYIEKILKEQEPSEPMVGPTVISELTKEEPSETMEPTEITELSELTEEIPIERTIEEKIISPSFDEKLEEIKKEIEQIDIRGKKKTKKEKECPEDKERNPYTGRCVNKCKPGYIRNPKTFKCEK